MKKLTFGLKKSKSEPHDKILCFSTQCKQVDFPERFSLKDRVKEVYDQLSLNACSANAAASFLALSDKDDMMKCSISRLYLYFTTRWIDKKNMLPVEDQGATLRSVFTAISSYHYIDEIKYPYEIEKCDSIPPKEIFEEAITINKCPFTSYKQINQTKCSIKYALYMMQQPILFGMTVYSNFMRLTKENDVLTLPTAEDELLGAHAVCCVSFDDQSETFEILNSHGSDVANGGYFRMKYEYMLNPDLCFEMYIVNN